MNEREHDPDGSADIRQQIIKPEYVTPEEGELGSDAEPPKRSFGGFFWLAALLLVAVAGFGSSTGWFGLASTGRPAGDPVADSKSPIADVINAQLDEARANVPGSDVPRITSLPSLTPLQAKDSDTILTEGREVAAHLVATTSRSTDALEMQARFEFEFGDPEVAKKLWTQILQRNPNYVYSLRGLGDIATLEGDLDTAVNFFRKAVLAEPQNTSRQITLAVALLAAGELEEARQVLEGVLAAQPTSLAAHLQLGHVQLQQKDFQGAKQAFQAVLELDPDHAEAHYGLATALLRLGQTEQAKVHQEEHVRLREENKQETRRGRKDYDDVQALQIDVGNLYTDMARVYLNAGNAQAAELLLVRASRMNAADIQPRQAMAWISVSKGLRFDAIRWLGEVASLEPNEFSYASEIASLYAEVEQLDESEATLLDFSKQNPEHAEALLALSQFYLEVRPDLEKSIEFAKRATAAAPSGAGFAWLATVYQENRQTPQAIQALQRAIELAPANAEYPQLLALIRQTEQKDTSDGEAKK